MTSPQTLLRDIAFCILFFTRLPLPEIQLTDCKLSEAIWAAPVAGWIVALIGGATFWAASGLGLPAGPAAALALAATMLATGCLHEDGLSDTADGFGGGRHRERILEIMRDSRIGAFGACALALSILLRWSALAALATGSAASTAAASMATGSGGTYSTSAAVFAALIAAHGASRALLPVFLHLLPPARADGLSAGAGSVEAPVASAALALGFLSLLALGFSAALMASALLAAAFFLFRALCLKKIGGQTGDTAGAFQQIAEILVLLVACAVF